MQSQVAHLILVAGLPGSGKTYFATRLATRLDAVHYNSDKVRKSLTADPVYSSSDRQSIYEQMFESVCNDLMEGKEVVVDATFSRQDYRKPYLDFAKKNSISVHIIYLEASEAVIKERVSKKREDSDADFEVYQKIKKEYEPLMQAHLTLRTDKPDVEENLVKAEAYINSKVR